MAGGTRNGGTGGDASSPGARFDQTVDLTSPGDEEGSLGETMHLAAGAVAGATPFETATPFEQPAAGADEPPPELTEALALRDQVTAQASAAFEEMQRMAAETMAAAKSRFEGNPFDLSNDAGRGRALATIMTADDKRLESLTEQCRRVDSKLEVAHVRQLRDSLRALGEALAAQGKEDCERISQVAKILGVTS